jgi:hypothetical protein
MFRTSILLGVNMGERTTGNVFAAYQELTIATMNLGNEVTKQAALQTYQTWLNFYNAWLGILANIPKSQKPIEYCTKHEIKPVEEKDPFDKMDEMYWAVRNWT